MIIVSGKIYVTPGSRDEYIERSLRAIESARATRGCLDFVVAPDPVDANRVNVYEEWSSESQLHAFRDAGPGADLTNLIQDVQVTERSFDAWSAVDEYVARVFGLDDPALERTLSRSREAGLPDIQVSPAQGALLEVLARAVRARLVVEIGTLGGYSAIFLARGLVPGGRVVTLELDPNHAEVARANLSDAGVGDRVEVREGPALDSLARLRGELEEPVDLVFIDADKRTYPEYLAAVVPMCRSGTLIVADNVVREGAVADESNDDPDIVGARQLNRAIADDDRLRGTVIQTVGVKGHDGLAIAVVRRSDPSDSPGGPRPAPGAATE